MDALYIGLMSGTSCDGVNAALVDFSSHFECVHTFYQPYPDDLRQLLLKFVRERQADFAELLNADNDVAVIHALAVKKLLANANIEPQRIRALGFHGQTLYHQPGGAHPNSLQIGDPALLVERTGITTVSDFRRRDMAVGGQGAPLTPAFHDYLFRKEGVTRAIVNIGGIANITLLPGNPVMPVFGFDTGPGNCLLDEWYHVHHAGAYDINGDWARSGKCDNALLQTLLRDQYFTRPAPKSTGREYFHFAWLTSTLNMDNVAPADLQATLTQLTAETISAGIKQAADVQEVYVCGGGVHNQYLLGLLQDLLHNIQVNSTETVGLSPDWVEACAFAWFAKQRLEGKALALQSVTGASKDSVAGAIYQH